MNVISKVTKKLFTPYTFLIASILIVCSNIFLSLHNTSSASFEQHFLFPLASSFSHGKYAELIIDTGYFYYSLSILLFLLNLVVTFLYMIIKLVDGNGNKLKYIIPFLIAVAGIPLTNTISESSFAKKASYDSDFIMERAENLVVENTQETEKFQKMNLPPEYSKLSSTGIAYYRKFNGQTEYYFPRPKTYNNNYQEGYLYLSNADTSNINNIIIVTRSQRYGWYNTFSRNISEIKKP